MTEIEKGALERALTLCLLEDDEGFVPAPRFVPSPPHWRLQRFYEELLSLRGYEDWKTHFWNPLIEIFGSVYIATAFAMDWNQYERVASSTALSRIRREKQLAIRELLSRVKKLTKRGGESPRDPEAGTLQPRDALPEGLFATPSSSEPKGQPHKETPSPVTSVPEAATETPVSNAFTREGDVWRLRFEGKEIILKNSKGLEYIAELLRKPSQDIGVEELAGALLEASIPMVEPEILARLKQEFADTAELLREAEESGSASTSGLSEQKARLEEELSRLMGLGGQSRQFSNTREKARKAVAKCIKDALERVKETHPALERHLYDSIKLGTTCSYRPAKTVHWDL